MASSCAQEPQPLPNQGRVAAVRNISNGYVATAVCVAVSGLSVGWLIGLSISPVLQIIIESLLGLIVSFLSVVAGLTSVTDRTSKNEVDEPLATPPRLTTLRIDLVPLALFTVT